MEGTEPAAAAATLSKGAAGFQILLLTKREALKAGKTVRLTGHSKAVTELIDLYNMAGYFGDPMLIPAEERAAANPGNGK